MFKPVEKKKECKMVGGGKFFFLCLYDSQIKVQLAMASDVLVQSDKCGKATDLFYKV